MNTLLLVVRASVLYLLGWDMTIQKNESVMTRESVSGKERSVTWVPFESQTSQTVAANQKARPHAKNRGITRQRQTRG